MKKINIAELLMDCPEGMELDCTIWDNVKLRHIDNTCEYPIYITIEENCHEQLTKYGQWNYLSSSKCVIFPKGKTTWEGFVPPHQIKDGDIISNDFGSICIFKGEGNIKGTVDFYCGIDSIDFDELLIKDVKDKDEHFGDIDNYQLASEEEKQKFFDTIKANGYKWNFETKTLEKLIIPKFKKGDKVRVKDGVSEPRIIEDVCDTFYTLIPVGTIDFTIQDCFELVPDNFESESNSPKFKEGDRIKHIKGGEAKVVSVEEKHYNISSSVGISAISISMQHEWDLMPNKFDIDDLKPYESRVLVRTSNNDIWRPAIYGFTDSNRYYVVGGVFWKKCIPYDENKELLGTNNDCDDFYKTWEE